MGSGVWFKNIINKKKVKGHKQEKVKKYSAPEKINQQKEPFSENEHFVPTNSVAVGRQGRLGPSIEDVSAIRIQTAYRAYLARKTVRRMRGILRLQNLVECDSVKKQAAITLSHLHSWNKIQSQIRARRVHMVTEGRLRQKKLESQLKLEAKLHDLEVEWSGGTETMDVALARIHQREEAAVRRERALAYAFSHQWRANSSPSFGSENDELGKANWGWSWMDRWIAACPWESRVPTRESPKKTLGCQPSKTGKNTTTPVSKTPAKIKLISPNGKAARKSRKLSFDAADQKKVAPKPNDKAEDEKIKNGKEGS